MRDLGQVFRLVVLTMAPLFLVILALMALGLVEVMGSGAGEVGDAQHTGDRFWRHWRVELAMGLATIGIVGTGVTGVGVSLAYASGLYRRAYLWRLRREAMGLGAQGVRAPVVLAQQMLAIEQGRQGWQMQTLERYMDIVESGQPPLDWAFLDAIEQFCDEALCAADSVLSQGLRRPTLPFSGQEWHASDLATQSSRMRERVRALRRRDDV
jgi:hypothetical protein